MAIALRAFGLPDESSSLCDRADALSRTVLAEFDPGCHSRLRHHAEGAG
ncbi:hypothetical protein [Allokutzneria albata]|uniref:Uncharacterized protein n=1 Tax=Allokutzneria albata TaxID=211114 RepID=A0A1G9S3X4_ALLAB|nr:hypothetical protein [Allokutzneria albata]SDM30213.1 hypothetical protein SAMN04489726_0876 [Allokutzneria albata]